MVRREKRFRYHIMVSVSDRIDGGAVKIDSTINADTVKEVYEGIAREAKDLPKHFLGKCVEPLTKEDLLEKALYLRSKKKWGNRRIRNWFARFGLEVDLPDTKVVNKDGQQLLPLAEK